MSDQLSFFTAPILSHPLWPLVRPWITFEVYDRDGGHAHPRYRLECHPPPSPSLRKVLLDIETTCARCGKTIHPIRARKGSRHNQLFLAVSCDLDTCYGCSRGPEARDAYIAIRLDLQREQ